MPIDFLPLGVIQKKGLPKLIREFFDDLFKREELPVSPYPDLVQRFRIAESAEGESISTHAHRSKYDACMMPGIRCVVRVNDMEGADSRAHPHRDTNKITVGAKHIFSNFHHVPYVSRSRFVCTHTRFPPSAKGLFCSIEDDAKTCEKARNNVAVSPELSGVTYVQGSRGIWGLPHILQLVDSGHLENMKALVGANEELFYDGQHVSYGKDYVVNVWVGLTGPAVLAGRLYRCRWWYRCMQTKSHRHSNHTLLILRSMIDTGVSNFCRGQCYEYIHRRSRKKCCYVVKRRPNLTFLRS